MENISDVGRKVVDLLVLQVLPLKGGSAICYYPNKHPWHMIRDHLTFWSRKLNTEFHGGF